VRRDLSKIAFAISGALFILGYGVAVGTFELFPFRFLQDGWYSARAVRDDLGTALGIRPGYFLFPARHPGSGVTHYDRARAAPGLTLIQGFFDGGNELRLIQLDGSIVHRWPVKYFDIFPRPTHIAPASAIPKRDWNVETHGAQILPDGSVVFNFEYAGTVKLDRCGRLQWTVPRMTHHSVETSSDGGFWIPSQRYVSSRSSFPALRPPYVEETILNVSATGAVVREISVLELLLNNDLQGLLFMTNPMRPVPNDVVPHLNDVEELSPELAPHFPQFAAGDLLLSFRGLNLLMVVDPNTLKVKWHQVGRWLAQHDPDFEPNGRISLFNNNNPGGDIPPNVLRSNILEVDPRSGATSVRYGSESGPRMFTESLGEHQYLDFDGGHILIVEAAAGRVAEVDSAGGLVWEFINRFSETEVAQVADALRRPEPYFMVRDWACD
jgi:Arylsulfotransferase (ASST)